jgi:hypothetical protein
MAHSKAGVSFDSWIAEQLKKDRDFTVECLIASMESPNNPGERWRADCDACCRRGIWRAGRGCGTGVHQPGSLYRARAPMGNPTLKTLIAVLNAVGLRLSVTPVEKVRKRQSKTRTASVAA